MQGEFDVMPPNISVAAFVFGIVFILAALIGKELEVIAIKIPALTRLTRTILGVLGVGLIYLGVFEPFSRAKEIANLEPSPVVEAKVDATFTSTPLSTEVIPIIKTAEPSATSTPTDVPTIPPSVTPTALPISTPTDVPTIPPSVTSTALPISTPSPVPTDVPIPISTTAPALVACLPDNAASVAEHVSFPIKIPPVTSVTKSVNLIPGQQARYELFILENQILTVNTTSSATIQVEDTNGIVLGSGQNSLSVAIPSRTYYYIIVTGSGCFDIDIIIPPPPQ